MYFEKYSGSDNQAHMCKALEVSPYFNYSVPIAQKRF